jgi:hypothetical protein
VTDEETFSVKTHRSLRYVFTRTGGSGVSARREPPAVTARIRVSRGLIIPALVFAGAGAAIAASAGHGTADHVQATAYQRADSVALWARTGSKKFCEIDGKPWMYAAVDNKPWMYIQIDSKPWMYVANKPWMYVASKPWMYAVSAGGKAGLAKCPASVKKAVPVTGTATGVDAPA